MLRGAPVFIACEGFPRSPSCPVVVAPPQAPGAARNPILVGPHACGSAPNSLPVPRRFPRIAGRFTMESKFVEPIGMQCFEHSQDFPVHSKPNTRRKLLVAKQPNLVV